MITTVIFFILLIGVLVLVHELGHFFAAKKLGVRVSEFAFGFPPRLLSVVRGKTRYTFNLLPFGGYVKIFGESGEGEGISESFISRPIWQRLLIIAAGVFMNFLLAWAFFSINAGIGVPTAVDDGNNPRIHDVKVGIVGVAKGSPAEAADIRFGDLVMLAKSDAVEMAIMEPDNLQEFVFDHRGEEIILVIERGKEVLTKKIIPREDTPEGEGPIGVALSKIGIFRAPWYAAWWEGLKMLFNVTTGIVIGFIGLIRDLFATGKVSADVSGPVGIFMFARDFSALGVSYLLQLAAILSINLAILNALPFPALDGGRILFLAIEKIKGSRVNQEVERVIHTVGFAVLIMLMLAVTYRDIAKIF